MNALPAISVIVPSFNQGHFLEETLRSLIAQQYEGLELIVIDGGSKDRSVEVIRAYSNHIQYWVSEPDRGQSEAINKGLARASGEIVTWLNSDDLYKPGALHRVAAAFRDDPALGIFHGRAVLFGEGRASQEIGLTNNIARHDYFPYMRFPQPASFIRRRELLPVLPVSENLHYAMDFELVVRMLLRGANILRTNEVLARYRLHESSKSNDGLSFRKEWSLVVDRFFRSVEGGAIYSGYLRDLSLVDVNDHVTYQSVQQFTQDELRSVFLQHLDICYHSYYQALDRNSCRTVSRFVKNFDPQLYRANNYARYNFRLKIIPKFVFRFMRS